MMSGWNRSGRRDRRARRCSVCAASPGCAEFRCDSMTSSFRRWTLLECSASVRQVEAISAVHGARSAVDGEPHRRREAYALGRPHSSGSGGTSRKGRRSADVHAGDGPGDHEPLDLGRAPQPSSSTWATTTAPSSGTSVRSAGTAQADPLGRQAVGSGIQRGYRRREERSSPLPPGRPRLRLASKQTTDAQNGGRPCQRTFR